MSLSSSIAPSPIVRIRDLGRLIGGGTPSRKKPDFFRGAIPWITTQDIPEDDVATLSSARDYISEEAISESATNIVDAGCILVATRVTVGKTAISGTRMCFSQDVTAILLDRPDLVDAMYVARCLRSRRASLLQKNQGSTIAGITRDTLALEQIPLPPLSEQRRIVAILHEAEEVRRGRAALEGSTDRLAFVLFSNIFGPPDSWGTGTKLNNIVSFVGGGTPSRNVAHFFRGAIPWATPKDMGELYLADTEEHITEEAIAASATSLVPAGTVLVVVKSKILAHTLPLAIAPRSMCFGQDLKGLVPKQGIPPEFVVYALRAQLGRILARARGANTEGLTLEALRPLPVPPINTDLINVFERGLDEIKILNREVSKEPNYFKALAASLSAQAYSGRLTANWRDQKRDQLAREATERDAWLATQGVAHSRPAAVDLRISGRFIPPHDGLTTDQTFIMMQIYPDEPGKANYITAQSLAIDLEGRLHNDARTIDGHLTVLADRGLIIPVSREVDDPNAGTIYRRAYRLPRDEDRMRSAEIARLADTLGTGARR